MKVAGVRVRRTVVAYVLFEDLLIVALLLGAFAFAHFGRLEVLRSPLDLATLLGLLLAIKAAFFWLGLYDFSHDPPRHVFLKRLGIGIGVVYAAAWLLWCVASDERVACMAFLAFFAPMVLASRAIYEFIAGWRGFKRRLLFLGVGEQARRTAREIIDERKRDYELVGFLGESEAESGWRIGGRPVLGIYADLERVVAAEGVHQIVVAVKDRRKQLPLDALLRARLAGVEVVEEAKVHEEITGKLPVEDLRPSWLIFSEGFARTPVRDFTKRAFDMLVALIGLVLSAPFALLVTVAIKLESPGPVLFRQKRVGRGGREFTILKFRSMRTDAEKEGKPIWATKNDPRVTRVGRFIRSTRLDEIPQMWNVLTGSMSFVGPRPERHFFVERLRETIPYYDQRHAVKPGITGWAQVRFRYGADETDAVEKLRHDMFYVKHRSILFDLRILMETVRVVFQKNMGR